MAFKAFISYSHSADARLAPAVQRALHGVARPWYRLRTMRVFRDQANLAASPGLWSSIEAALGDSEFFLFMASPAAARSPWVGKEVDWWLTHRSPRTFLILLTEGEIAWDEARRDFDWAATTALPARLSGAFDEEPLWADLRWARTEDELSVRHSRFRAAVLELGATLLGRPKDELDGDDVRQYRRTRRIAWSAAAVLAVLFVAAVLAAYAATRQRDIAVSRALGASAEAVLPTSPELALLLALEAVRVEPDAQAEHALRTAFARSPRWTMHAAPPGRTVLADFVGPDLVLAAEPGGRAAVWSVSARRRVAGLPGEAGDWPEPSGAPDGSLLALRTGEADFSLVDPRSGRVAARLPGSGPRFSGNRALLVAVAGGELRRWDVPSLRERTPRVPVPEGYVVRDVSADGGMVLLTGNSEISAGRVVEAGSGRVLAELPQGVFRDGAVFGPDGGVLVRQSLDGTRFELWDPRTGRRLRALEEPWGIDIGWTTYVAFSPDGRTLVAGNRNGVLHHWDVGTGEFRGAMDEHRNYVEEIRFGADGGTMLTLAADGTARLWDTGSMRCIATLGGRGDDALDAAFAADGARFLTTHRDGTVRVWHREAWYPVLSFPGDRAVASADGRRVLAAGPDGALRLRDTRTGRPVLTLPGAPERADTMALSPDGSLVAVAPAGGPVRVWSAATGREALRLPAASAGATALAFGPDGARLATGGADGRVRFWSVRDARLLGEWQTAGGEVRELVLHPDGETVVVASVGGAAQVRRVRSGEVLLETRLEPDLEDVALDAGGGRLLVSGDNAPQLWDLAARSRLRTLAGHTDDVFSGAFSRDGRLVLTGSGTLGARPIPPEDGNAVRVWDAGSGRELVQYRSAGMAVRRVAFGGDGATVVAASMDGVVRVYRCEVCLPLPALLRLARERASRGLTAEERLRYLPPGGLLGWQ